MMKQDLLDELKKCAANGDTEVAHADADELLLTYINDNEVNAAFGAVCKW